MYRPGTSAVLDGAAGFEAESARAAMMRSGPEAIRVPATAGPAPVYDVSLISGIPAAAGLPAGLQLPCADDPDLFFAEAPEDIELAKSICRGCTARLACLAGAVERREPWGVWGGELFLRGEIVPRKRPRGRPRKTDVAA
jgi:WhiB family redox-sensing transcriptional regulator